MLTETEYHAETVALAKYARELAEENNAELSDTLHEMIDSHEWVIYTTYHYQVLALSNNSGAHVEAFGTDGLVRGGQLNTGALAYMALLTDVQERIDDTQGF